MTVMMKTIYELLLAKHYINVRMGGDNVRMGGAFFSQIMVSVALIVRTYYLCYFLSSASTCI